jgi:hypothetical protein
MEHAHQRRCFFDMCALRTQARLLTCLEGWRAVTVSAQGDQGHAIGGLPATPRHDAWLQISWSMSIARQRLRMAAASATAGRAARADFAVWAEDEARRVPGRFSNAGVFLIPFKFLYAPSHIQL